VAGRVVAGHGTLKRPGLRARRSPTPISMRPGTRAWGASTLGSSHATIRLGRSSIRGEPGERSWSAGSMSVVRRVVRLRSWRAGGLLVRAARADQRGEVEVPRRSGRALPVPTLPLIAQRRGARHRPSTRL